MIWMQNVQPEWPSFLQQEPLPEQFLLDEEHGFEGTVKQKPEDFQVTEILSSAPTGAGPNTYIRVQKRNMTTPTMIQVLADYLDRSPRDFCVADYKDRQSIAIQWVSLEHLDPRSVDDFQHENIKIIQISRHPEKLKRVDLKGNRYEITIRDVGNDALENARHGLDILQTRGVPNWFGSQKFGIRRTNHFLGWALIKKKWEWFLFEHLNHPMEWEDERIQAARSSAREGDWTRAMERFPEQYLAQHKSLESLKRYPDNKERAIEVIPEDRRDYVLSALQAFSFNAFLSERLERFDMLHQGDVAYMHESAGCFPVMDPKDEKPRLERFEISPTGPLFGEKFLGASGDVGQLEDEILEAMNLTYNDFQRTRYPIQGRRRPLRLPIGQIRTQKLDKDQLELGFFLPRGGYATVVLEELMHRRLTLNDEEI